RLRVPPAANVSPPADVLIRSFDPPLTAPPRVSVAVPEPPTVVVAARVTAGLMAALPAPLTVTVGLEPSKLRPLPARVTVPVVLLNVSALRVNGLAMSFVAV